MTKEKNIYVFKITFLNKKKNASVMELLNSLRKFIKKKKQKNLHTRTHTHLKYIYSYCLTYMN